MLLARYLPHAVARRLGAVLGRAAGRLGGGARRRALSCLRDAFPDLDDDGVERRLGAAAAHRGATIFDGVSACRFDDRALCRRLTLERWSRLDAEPDVEQGLCVLGAGFGSWQIAALAMALYRGPIETLGPWRGDPVFGRLAASFERHGDRRLFGELAGGEQLEWTLLAGDRVGFLADRPAGHGEEITAPFLGREIGVKTLVARASIDTGAPVVPVFGRLQPRGRWSVEVREPILPAGEDVEALTARYLAAVEREIRRRPELWLGWW